MTTLAFAQFLAGFDPYRFTLADTDDGGWMLTAVVASGVGRGVTSVELLSSSDCLEWYGFVGVLADEVGVRSVDCGYGPGSLLEALMASVVAIWKCARSWSSAHVAAAESMPSADGFEKLAEAAKKRIVGRLGYWVEADGRPVSGECVLWKDSNGRECRGWLVSAIGVRAMCQFVGGGVVRVPLAELRRLVWVPDEDM